MSRISVGFRWGAACLLCLAISASVFAQLTVGSAMRNKLRHAQSILEGLAIEDFDMIAQNAAALEQLTRSTEWKPLPEPLYSADLRNFQDHTVQLQQKARARNLDGSTLAYVELTLSCVKCHEHLRSLLRGR